MTETSVIKTAGRIFEVLEMFDEIRRPASLKQIAETFAYPISSASVLLKSLVLLGYLDYDRSSRTYMPTMRCTALGHWVPGALFKDNQVLDTMERLSDVTSQPVSIATQSDMFAQYLHILVPASFLKVNVKAGTVRSLAKSGLGWVLLSPKNDAAIDKIVRRINYGKETCHRITLPKVMSEVDKIRKRGFVFSKHTVQHGYGVIGMMTPIRQNGRAIALGVGGRVSELEQKCEVILEQMSLRIGTMASNVTSRSDLVCQRQSERLASPTPQIAS